MLPRLVSVATITCASKLATLNIYTCRGCDMARDLRCRTVSQRECNSDCFKPKPRESYKTGVGKADALACVAVFW
eukprot:5961674-Pleurochrysis_carterae.AAC.1